MSIHPIKLFGNWKEGFALDIHVIQSIYLGENEYGRPDFDTTRSEIGDLVYKLKYRHEEDIVYDIIELTTPFLEQWSAIDTVDVIIPAPPSNKNRNFQPVFLISEKIAESINKPIVYGFLDKLTSDQIKNSTIEERTRAVSGSIVRRKKFKKKVNVLVIDDLYESGTTLKEVCNVLKSDENVNNVYVLTMTKTKG